LGVSFIFQKAKNIGEEIKTETVKEKKKKD